MRLLMAIASTADGLVWSCHCQPWPYVFSLLEGGCKPQEERMQNVCVDSLCSLGTSDGLLCLTATYTVPAWLGCWCYAKVGAIVRCRTRGMIKVLQTVG